MVFWTYPKLQSFMKKRTIVDVTEVILLGDKVGYIIGTTSGLSTDNTLCLTNFKPSFKKKIKFQQILKEYESIDRACVISVDIKSWGPGKVKKATTMVENWISDYFQENPDETKRIQNLSEGNQRLQVEDINKQELLDEIKNLHKILGEKITLLQSLIDME